MFVQGEKSTATLTRDRGTRGFWGEENSAVGDTTTPTLANFSFSHNVAPFKELVQSKYPQSIEIAEPAAGEIQQDSIFSKYLATQNIYAPQPEADGSAFQKYYNTSNPVPYQSFKPKVMTDYQDFCATQRSEVDEALLQKIDEVQIYEPTQQTVNESIAADLDRDLESEAYLKLNAKGLIACITFIAITLLIITLVILNTVAISSGRVKIRDLRDRNTQLSQEYSEAERLRAQAFARGEAEAYRYAQSHGSVAPERVALPPISSYPLAPANPDASTNLFSQLSKFFGSLFR